MPSPCRPLLLASVLVMASACNEGAPGAAKMAEVADTGASADDADCLDLDWAIDTFGEACCTAAQRASADADTVCATAESRIASDPCLAVDHATANYDECCEGSAYELEGHGSACTAAELRLPPANDTEYRYAIVETEWGRALAMTDRLKTQGFDGDAWGRGLAWEFVADGSYYNLFNADGVQASCTPGANGVCASTGTNGFPARKHFCAKKIGTNRFQLKILDGTEIMCMYPYLSYSIAYRYCSDVKDKSRFKIARLVPSGNNWVLDRWMNGDQWFPCP